MTVNLAPEPDLLGLTTVILPEAAPSGTVAVIELSLFTVKLDALIPPKRTAVAPKNPRPVIVTTSPKLADDGLTRDGLGVEYATVKDRELSTPVSPSEISIRPEVAPDGTTASILLEEIVSNEASVPLNVTLVTVSSASPKIATVVPGAPLRGVKFEKVSGCAVCCSIQSI